MTPPTTPPPLPFAELMKLATPGPMKYQLIDSPKGYRWAISRNGVGWWVAVIPNGPQADEDVELIMRLWNWAHAGGVEELRDAYDTVKMVGYGLSAHRGKADRLRHSLALLDGQRNL